MNSLLPPFLTASPTRFTKLDDWPGPSYHLSPFPCSSQPSPSLSGQRLVFARQQGWTIIIHFEHIFTHHTIPQEPPTHSEVLVSNKGDFYVFLDHMSTLMSVRPPLFKFTPR
jgi:hypothetical protein